MFAEAMPALGFDSRAGLLVAFLRGRPPPEPLGRRTTKLRIRVARRKHGATFLAPHVTVPALLLLCFAV